MFFSFAEQGAVRNLRVTEETTNSFRVSWQPAPGAVIRYRLSYVPLSGAGEILEAQTIGPETSIVLQELFPITTYRVSVSAEYATGMGNEMQIDGTTKEGESMELESVYVKLFLSRKCQSDMYVQFPYPFFSTFSPWLSSRPPCVR